MSNKMFKVLKIMIVVVMCVVLVVPCCITTYAADSLPSYDLQYLPSVSGSDSAKSDVYIVALSDGTKSGRESQYMYSRACGNSEIVAYYTDYSSTCRLAFISKDDFVTSSNQFVINSNGSTQISKIAVDTKSVNTTDKLYKYMSFGIDRAATTDKWNTNGSLAASTYVFKDYDSAVTYLETGVLNNCVKEPDKSYDGEGVYLDNFQMIVHDSNAYSAYYIEFKYSIPHNDLYLYGDDMKIKQVLYSLIVNSLEKTKVGYVEFKVNVIEKYDYARVIFMVTDSGPGIEIDKINEILSSTGALDKEEVELLNKKEVDVKLCQKVIKLMGGNLMIKSDLGKGSEFILTIDQRVYHDETKGILIGYENVVNNYQKALIVSQDKTLISKVKNILNKNDVSYSVLYYGLDAVDKIKSHKKYDFILISDEMKEVSGLSTLKEMQKIKGFSSPCIVMLNESKKGLAKHYIEDGFSDYIINEDIDSLNKIIQKY